MKQVLLSGCTDKEYSYDALIDGAYNGAMTFHAIHAIRAADYQITYGQLQAACNARRGPATPSTRSSRGAERTSRGRSLP